MREIILSQGKVATVDGEDFEFLSQWKWTLSHYGYAYRMECYQAENGKKKSRAIWMHRLLLNTPKGMDTDHINGDGLDNRRCNLRVVTRSQNNMNRKPEKRGSSKYKGVHWLVGRKRWQASLTVNKKLIYIGRFKDEVDAALAYNLMAIDHFGEYAKLNKAA